ncbi:uncharacterized protein LOC142348335 [Convolutriloba macropyga]|uniref:uncharacterized protein LOC142348335 n=1 Tax=Convolutriloba macropyga TaxID=536237 RepID=UPI003F51EC76
MRDVFVDTIDTDTIETVTSLVGLVSPSPTLVPPPSAPNNNNNNNPPGHPPSSQPGDATSAAPPSNPSTAPAPPSQTGNTATGVGGGNTATSILVPFSLFSPMCALSERLMHHKYSTGEASLDPNYSQKDKLEEADFSSLAWKLHGLTISPQLSLLLYVILDPLEYLPRNVIEEEPNGAIGDDILTVEDEFDGHGGGVTGKPPQTGASNSITGPPPKSTETIK